jgi:glycosyltransferase involved in cell wall biosynthesis
MKIIFIVDTEDSALFISANQWCEAVGGKVYAATNFRSFQQLLSKLAHEMPDLIIFSWRQVLDVAFLSSKNFHLLNQIKSQSRLLALVADHSADQPDRLLRDFRLSKANLELVTVTERLRKFYINAGLAPIGVLLDRPDYDLIREVREEMWNRKPKSVIWVGNSEWGKRQGYVDHKGLHSKFKPFVNLAREKGISLESVVIDSANRKVSHREVLQNLAMSELLIFTSAAEGTGLPILEALGLGTNVISTDVGIVGEFSTIRVLPKDATPEDYLFSLIQWEQEKVSPQETISDFERYMHLVDYSWQDLLSKIEFTRVSASSSDILVETGVSRIFKLFLWNLRFLVKWARNVK